MSIVLRRALFKLESIVQCNFGKTVYFVIIKCCIGISVGTALISGFSRYVSCK